MTHRFLARPVLMLAAALAAGCTVFPNPEPPRVMTLTLHGPATVAAQTHPHVLRVDTPYAPEPFNSTRILAKPTAWEFRSYADVRWRDTAPMLVRDLLVEGLRQSQAFEGVIADTSPAEASLTLVTELSGFHVEEPADTPRVTMQVHARVIDAGSHESLCSQTFRVEEAAAGPGIDQVVRAFDVAGQTLASRVLGWITTCRFPPAPGTDPATQP